MSFTTEPFTQAFVDELVAVGAGRPPIAGLSGTVGLAIGSKIDAGSTDVVIEIRDGRAVGAVDAEPEVVIGLTARQVEAWRSGDLVLARAYMMGDLKPVGASGPLFAALELLDWFADPAR